MKKYDDSVFSSGKLELAEMADALKAMAAQGRDRSAGGTGLILVGAVIGAAVSIVTMVAVLSVRAPVVEPRAVEVISPRLEEAPKAVEVTPVPVSRGRSGR